MNTKNVETMNFAKPAAECFRTSMEAGIRFQQETLRMMNEMMENWSNFVNKGFRAFDEAGSNN